MLQIGHSGQLVHPSPAATGHTQVSLTVNTDASLFIFSKFFGFFSDVTAPSCSTLVASRETIDGRAVKHREERVNRRTISNLYCYPCAGPQFKPIVNPTSLFMMFMTVHDIVTRGNREKTYHGLAHSVDIMPRHYNAVDCNLWTRHTNCTYCRPISSWF